MFKFKRQGEKDPKRKLKKQPPLQRAQSGSTVAAPKLVVPKQAKQRVQRRRRARAQQQLVLPLQWFKRLIFTSRWLSLALFATAVYGLYFVGQQTDYQISQVPVEGLYAIPATEVLAQSGLSGQHIFAADPELAAERISTMPGILAATVEVTWPNQARITVQEDTPVAVVRQGEETVWVNEAGELLPARLDLPELLHIEAEGALLMGYEGASSEPVEETDTAPAPAQLVQGRIPTAVLAGAQQLQTLLPEQNHFRYTPQHGLIYDDPQGWAVYLGTGEDMHQKLVVYNVLLSELQTQGRTPEYISVSNQNQPFYKAFGGESTAP